MNTPSRKAKDAKQEEIIESLEEKREEIMREIDEYNKERDQIRAMLGKIGGKSYSNTDMIINIAFLTIILVLFSLEITTHFLPTYISLEVSVLLVSIKIVWMIHSQHRFNHFQFWILNSLEFRVNNMHKSVRKIEKSLKEQE